MPAAHPTATSRPEATPPPRRPLEAITTSFGEITSRTSRFVACEPGRFELGGQHCELPRYRFLGPAGGSEPLRIGIFAGIHGDAPATSFALLRFVRLLEHDPRMARGYWLFLYPVCNPTGFQDNTRHNRNGKDLNRAFWRNSRQPEVRLLESELRAHAFDGIILLLTDETSDGVVGRAQGDVLARYLLRPALAAASDFLPLTEKEAIGGFRAADGIIRGSLEGALRAPPGLKPRPFEITLEAPRQAPQFLQEAALAVALPPILAEYRQFIAYALNL